MNGFSFHTIEFESSGNSLHSLSSRKLKKGAGNPEKTRNYLIGHNYEAC